MVKKITKQNVVLKLIGDRLYELQTDLEYLNGLIVPKGFKTNLASVPVIFEKILPHDGPYSTAAILHDFLYSNENCYGINKDTADAIFYQMMILSGVERGIAKLLYRSVKLFGQPFYKKNKKNGSIPYQKKALIDVTKEHKEYQESMKKLLKDWYVK